MKKIALLLLTPFVIAGNVKSLSVSAGITGAGIALEKDIGNDMTLKVATSGGMDFGFDGSSMVGGFGATIYKSFYSDDQRYNIDIGAGIFVLGDFPRHSVLPMPTMELAVGRKITNQSRVQLNMSGAAPISLSYKYTFKQEG